MRLLREIFNFERNYLTLMNNPIRVILFLSLFLISTYGYTETNDNSVEYTLNHATNLSGYREAKSIKAKDGNLIILDDDDASKSSDLTLPPKKKN